jgi:type II secretory pathway component GspD/PulD (secretin)
MLDTVLAQNHIAMVYFGDKGVKAVSSAQAFMERPPEVDLPWQLLPESSSVMCRTVHLKYIIPSETIAVMQPFSSLGNGIIPIDASQTIILRDYSVNIRQQLKLLEELDQKKNVK